MAFAGGGRPGRRFVLPSYLAAMRFRYQRRSVSGVAMHATSASASRPNALAWTASRRRSSSESLRTRALKPGSEHTVLLSEGVDHVLLLAGDPAGQDQQEELQMGRHHGYEENTLRPDECTAYGRNMVARADAPLLI